MPRSLITGGAGFLGSHLADRLLAEGHSVVCLDSMLTGASENISHLRNEKRFEFIQHDVTKFIDIKGQIDYVLHFASPASPADYKQYPIQTLKVGSLGTHNALGLAKEKNAVFLLASSSEVYGDPQVHPQTEDYWGFVNPVGPRGVYDEAKRFAEALVLAYHRTHKMRTRIARIFNTYGPRMRAQDGRAVPAFITQSLRGEDITVFGSGNQTRSFCYVTDTVEGIFRLLLSEVAEPVNIGNPDEVTVLEVAREIIELTRSKSRIVFMPLPEDDPRVRCPDIARARKFLDWQPLVDRKEGLTKTIDYFKQKLSAS
jgi:dTDP-glucose 4,6-dehydratase